MKLHRVETYLKMFEEIFKKIDKGFTRQKRCLRYFILIYSYLILL